jgi:hypothetical protein
MMECKTHAKSHGKLPVALGKPTQFRATVNEIQSKLNCQSSHIIPQRI